MGRPLADVRVLAIEQFGAGPWAARSSRVFEDLVRVSDAVHSNPGGDQPARLGITYDALRGVNERVVCCSLSGFGTTGPRARRGHRGAAAGAV